MSTQRLNAVIESVTRPGKLVSLTIGRTADWPQKATGGNAYSADIYGSQVFTLSKLQATLPKPVYNRFIQQQKGRQPLDRPTADAIAHAVRIWSMDRGATHFTHWFQPQTGNGDWLTAKERLLKSMIHF